MKTVLLLLLTLTVAGATRRWRRGLLRRGVEPEAGGDGGPPPVHGVPEAEAEAARGG